MDKIFNKLEKPLSKISEAIGRNKLLIAIKDSFIYTLPFVVISSLITVITWTIDFNLKITTGIFAEISMFLKNISGAVSSIHGLLIVITAAYFFSLTKEGQKNFNKITATLSAVAAYMVIIPMFTKTTAGELVNGVIKTSFLNYEATFIGLIAALLTVKLYSIFITKLPTIKLPGNVPPAIFNSFFSLIPLLTIFLIFGGIRFGVEMAGFESVNQLVQKAILAPLQSIGTGLPAMIIIMILMQLLWFFGLHGFSIVWGLIGMLWIPFFMQQLTLFTTTGDITAFASPSPNVITLIYGMIGGSGCTLGLIVAMLLLAPKKSAERTIAKLSLVPGLFNINEPVIFGMPIVLNPLMFIPFICIPLVNIIIAYFAHILGYVSPIIASGSGAEPIFVNVFMLSGGKLSPVLLYGALFILDIILWIPFAKMLCAASSEEIK